MKLKLFCIFAVSFLVTGVVTYGLIEMFAFLASGGLSTLTVQEFLKNKKNKE